MTVLQDVRFVNASRFGTDCYINEHWVLLPHLMIAVRLKKCVGWSGDKDWSSIVFEEPSESMPQEVQDWFSHRITYQ